MSSPHRSAAPLTAPGPALSPASTTPEPTGNLQELFDALTLAPPSPPPTPPPNFHDTAPLPPRRPQPGSPLLTLPSELLLQVASFLPQSSVAALLGTCARLAHLLTPELYKAAAAAGGGLAPLQHAARTANAGLTRTLLELYGVDVRARDDVLGRTALHVAAEAGAAEVVALLLERATELECRMRLVNARTKTGENALFLAALAVVEREAQDGGSGGSGGGGNRDAMGRECVRLLRNAGADRLAAETKAVSALHEEYERVIMVIHDV